MKRIAVVTSSPPFVEGGHLVIARSLVQALREHGHEASLIVTPQNRFGRQASAYLATWLTDVGEAPAGRIDQVISLRYPSYAVRHPAHVCWLNHTMREYYDRWESFSATLSSRARLKEDVRRRLIQTADGYLLRRNVHKLVAQSETVRRRLATYLNLASDVLHPPPPPRAYRCEGYGDYIFAVSRLTPLKRLDLLIRALGEPVASNVRCVIAGEGEEASALASLAARLGVAGRVTFAGRVSEAALLDHLARCRGVCFPTLDEDYGFVTVEAFASARAVITCRDSGGPAELVVDGVNGFVREPTPAALGAALARMMSDRDEAIRMGEAAAHCAASLTWERTVEKLLLQ